MNGVDGKVHPELLQGLEVNQLILQSNSKVGMCWGILVGSYI